MPDAEPNPPCNVTDLLLPPAYAAIVHCYASIAPNHARTGTWARLWGEELPTLIQLVVCELPAESRVCLLGLDANACVRFDSEHGSVSDAKDYAESEYQGLHSAWRVPSSPGAADA